MAQFIRAGIDEATIERETGVSDRSIRRWRLDIEKTGRIGKPPESRTGRRRAVTPEMERALFAWAQSCDDVGIDEMIIWLHKKYHVLIGTRTLRRVFSRRGLNPQQFKSKGSMLPQSAENDEDDSEEEAEGGSPVDNPKPRPMQQTGPQYQPSPYAQAMASPALPPHHDLNRVSDAQQSRPQPAMAPQALIRQHDPYFVPGPQQSTPQPGTPQPPRDRNTMPDLQQFATASPPSQQQQTSQQYQQAGHQHQPVPQQTPQQQYQQAGPQHQYMPQATNSPDDEELLQLELRQIAIQKQKLAMQEQEVALKLRLRRVQQSKAVHSPQSGMQQGPTSQGSPQQNCSQQGYPQQGAPQQGHLQPAPPQPPQPQQIQHHQPPQNSPSPSLATPSGPQTSTFDTTPLPQKRNSRTKAKQEESKRARAEADKKALAALHERSRKRDYLSAAWASSTHVWPKAAENLLANLMRRHDCYVPTPSNEEAFEAIYRGMYTKVDLEQGGWDPATHDEALRERIKRKMLALRSKMKKAQGGKQQGGANITSGNRVDGTEGRSQPDSLASSTVNMEMGNTQQGDYQAQAAAGVQRNPPPFQQHAHQTNQQAGQPAYQHPQPYQHQQPGQQMQYDLQNQHFHGTPQPQQSQMNINGHMNTVGHSQYPDPTFAQQATTQHYPIVDAHQAALMGYGQMAISGHGRGAMERDEEMINM